MSLSDDDLKTLKNAHTHDDLETVCWGGQRTKK